MKRTKAVKAAVLLTLLAVLVASVVLEAGAYGRWEFGFGVPVSTTFGFSSLSFGLEAYLRLLGSIVSWETALRTSSEFSSLYIANTIATTAALYLYLGHVTNVLPYFGSTYFTLGLGLALGRAFVVRVAAGIAASVSSHGVYWFPEIRFQMGLDP